MPKHHSKFDYNHPVYRAARAEAFARSNGKCQLCGKRDAVEAHHWAWPNYPDESETTADDLTAVCLICHEIVTALRRFEGDIWTFRAIFGKAIEECFTSAKSAESVRSSTTRGPDSTPEPLPTSKRRKSPDRKSVV